MSDKILNEQDPFLREIYAMGYNEILFNKRDQMIILIGDGGIKEIKKDEYYLGDFTIKTGILPDGNIHKWISEADGSCEKFRKLIAL